LLTEEGRAGYRIFARKLFMSVESGMRVYVPESPLPPLLCILACIIAV
jgi:hypothetical protein